MLEPLKTSALRMNPPPASNWLLAPMPRFMNNHSAPIAGWFHHFNATDQQRPVEGFVLLSIRWSAG
jgi:hypothetical protein